MTNNTSKDPRPPNPQERLRHERLAQIERDEVKIQNQLEIFARLCPHMYQGLKTDSAPKPLQFGALVEILTNSEAPPGRSVFAFGATGLGKTAAGWRAIERLVGIDPNVAWHFVKYTSFMAPALASTLSEPEYEEFTALLRQAVAVDVLVLDGFDRDTELPEPAANGLFWLLDSRIERNRATLITTTLGLHQFAALFGKASAPKIENRLRQHYTPVNFSK